MGTLKEKESSQSCRGALGPELAMSMGLGIILTTKPSLHSTDMSKSLSPLQRLTYLIFIATHFTDSKSEAQQSGNTCSEAPGVMDGRAGIQTQAI